MVFVKIVNLIQEFGNADYRGLNIKSIVAGSSLYIRELDGSTTAYFAYQGEIVNHPDVTEITEEEYHTIYEEEMERIRREQEEKPSPEQEIQQLKKSLAELGKVNEQQDIQIQELGKQLAVFKLNSGGSV